MSFRNVVLAEASKIRTLPAAVRTAAATVLVGALVGVAIAVSAVERTSPVPAGEVVVGVVSFLQIGVVALGVLTAAHEHAGPQFRTTLVVMPRRGAALVGKAIATVAALLLTAVIAVTAGLAAAHATAYALDGLVGETNADLGRVLSAGLYLAMVGLLAHAVAVLVRHLVPALVGVLGVLLVVSPLLAGVTDHARWLPDRAAAQLYQSTDTVLSPVTGTLVALAWIAAIGGVAAVRSVRRDA
ncbi:hypothetical protein [Actinoalloteichus caeruleus]|uniref:hypothetical protein n=1 Tax=Actinoalloteichus cyanogriseus TaxID=2893586 RepID=UPI00068F5AE3|nr:hypothetical protein [Actinoalloteichus caeruleus]